MLANKFSGVKVGQEEVVVSVLQFVDDTLMFTDATFGNVLCMKRTVRCFEVVSGLKVNFHTRKLGGICVYEAIVERYDSLLNCTIMEILILYLGIPIGTNSMKMTTWQPIIEKIIKTELATWKQ